METQHNPALFADPSRPLEAEDDREDNHEAMELVTPINSNYLTDISNSARLMVLPGLPGPGQRIVVLHDPEPEENHSSITETPDQMNVCTVASNGMLGVEEQRRIKRAIHFRENLERSGKFIQSDSDDEQAFYLDECSGQIIEINRNDRQFQMLLRQNGIPIHSRGTDIVLDELQLYAYERGFRVQIHHVSHFDQDKRVLYLDRFDGMMYRITEGEIDLVPVCTDGVLFLRNRKYEPFELMLDTPLEGSPLDDLLLKTARFDPDWFPDHLQARALRAWFLAGYLREIVPVLPALVVQGVFQSGKSYLLKTLGRIVVGSSFSLNSMPTQETFDLLASANKLFCIDNVERFPAWFEDKLAIAITGGNSPKRKLYTDRSLVDGNFKANIAVTCCAPRLIRVDVASRLLVLRTPKRLDTLPEHVLDRQLYGSRNLILTDVALRLQQILRAIDRVPLGSSLGSRLADFVQFLRVMAVAEGWEDGEVEELIEAINWSQSVFSSDNDPVDALMIGLLESCGGTTGLLSAGDIRTMLCTQASVESVPLALVPSAVAVGQKLSLLCDGHPRFKVTQIRRGANKKLYVVELLSQRGQHAL